MKYLFASDSFKGSLTCEQTIGHLTKEAEAVFGEDVVCVGVPVADGGERAKAKGIPAVGLCGSLGPGAEKIFEHGICSLMTTVDRPLPLDEALTRADELYYLGAMRMFRFLKIGMQLALL